MTFLPECGADKEGFFPSSSGCIMMHNSCMSDLVG